jgi:YVTN family beta-propeller protein
MMLRISILIAAGVLPQCFAAPVLDYQFFRERVQPILLAKRTGHARCISCHEHGAPPLQALPPGAANWDEAQSRKNFDMWKNFVTPGDPAKSKMLLHPLAISAGGDRFHAGGKHWASRSDPEWQTLAAWVRGETLASASVGGGVRVLQTNSAGDNVHVIDPATNQTVGVIDGIEVPHGVVIAPGGGRIYVTDESRRTLDVVDAKTLKVTNRIPLSGRPNNVAVSKDDRWVYVGIVEAPGAVDVIDTGSMVKAKSIAVKGGIHNVYVTPDGKWAVAGSIPSSTISVIDTATNTLEWSMTMDAGIRPMAFTRNANGSTKEIIVQLSGFHGFAVVDFAARKEVRRVTLPDPPGKEKETEGIQGSPSHGLAITPDGKLLWATSKYYGYVAAYSLPDFKLVKVVPVGSHPEWLTIPPDGRDVYVALAGQDAVAAVDNQSLQVVKMIPVGAVPKRNASGVLQ